MRISPVYPSANGLFDNCIVISAVENGFLVELLDMKAAMQEIRNASNEDFVTPNVGEPVMKRFVCKSKKEVLDLLKVKMVDVGLQELHS